MKITLFIYSFTLFLTCSLAHSEDDLSIYKTKWQQDYLATLDEDNLSLNKAQKIQIRRKRNSLFKKSYNEWKKENYQEAIDYAHKIISADPKDLPALELIYKIYIDKKDWVRALGSVVLLLKHEGAKKLLTIKSATAFRYYLRHLDKKLEFPPKVANYFYQLAKIEQKIFNAQIEDGYYKDIRKHTRLITKNLRIAEYFGFNQNKIQLVANSLKQKLQTYSPIVTKHVEKSFNQEVFEGEKQDSITKNELPTRDEINYDINENDVDYKGQAISRRTRKRDKEKVGKEFDWLASLSYVSWRERSLLTSDKILSNQGEFAVQLNIKGVCPGIAIENTRDIFSWSFKLCPFFGTGNKNSSLGGNIRGQNKIYGIFAGPAFYYHFGGRTFSNNIISIGVEAPLIYRKIALDTGTNLGVLSESKFSVSTGPALRFRGGPFIASLKYLISPLYERGATQFEFAYIF